MTTLETQPSLSQLLNDDDVVVFSQFDHIISRDIEQFALGELQNYLTEPIDVLSEKPSRLFHHHYSIQDSPSAPRTRPRPHPKLLSVDLEGDPHDIERDLAIEKWWHGKRDQMRLSEYFKLLRRQ